MINILDLYILVKKEQEIHGYIVNLIQIENLFQLLIK